eukprot:gb/GECG01005038.1/.p1 GENE.gb/GECG01005038.1/~~gb/GECG01005038.1/.p1  ORF type:complete len:394 (+),score=48.41 gb/GECG01005038.1/:1-1182(+)
MSTKAVSPTNHSEAALSVSRSAKPTNNNNEGTAVNVNTEGSSIPVMTGVILSATFGGIGVICLGFIAYRRQRNNRMSNTYDDPSSLYATQLGIPLSNFRVISNNAVNNNEGTPFQAQRVDVSDQALVGTHVDVGEANSTNRSSVYSKDTSGEYELAHINPLTFKGNCNSATYMTPCEDREQWSEAFSLKQKKAVQRRIGSDPVAATSDRVIQPTGLDSKPRPDSTVQAGSKPQVEFMDLGVEEQHHSEKIRVVSVAAPQLATGEKKASLGGNAVVRVALASSIPTGDMSTFDRTVLKLRQWKAKLLAEPPPLVEVQFHTSRTVGSESKPETESKCDTDHVPNPKDHAAQLDFAKRTQALNRDTLVREAKVKRETRARTGALKKEFGPMLPSYY